MRVPLITKIIRYIAVIKLRTSELKEAHRVKLQNKANDAAIRASALRIEADEYFQEYKQERRAHLERILKKAHDDASTVIAAAEKTITQATYDIDVADIVYHQAIATLAKEKLQ